MKKLISIIVTLALTLGLVVTPVLAQNRTTPRGVKFNPIKANQKMTYSLQKDLKKAKEQLKRLTLKQANVEANILKAIAKEKANSNKEITNTTAQQEKLRVDLSKAALKDVKELANLNNNIAKWTEAIQKQLNSLTQKSAAIDTNLNKQLAELDKKLIVAKDDATKQNIATEKINVQNYASQEKAAISTYMTSIQGIFADKQKVWAQRKDLLIRRQAADTAFRTAMTNVKIAELNDKLASLSKTPLTPIEIEVAVRAKYQKTVDAIKLEITKLNATIADLQLKLKK